MAKNYRVGVIGSTGKGEYGHGIDTVWKEIPRADVVAVADESEKGRAAATIRTGAENAYADFREMIEKEKPDIVAVCPRWIDRHLEMVMACVERGIHVYMEKPFCRTLEEADQIVRTCEMTHSKLAIAHQTRYCPILGVVKRMIDEGKLGTVLELRGRGKEDARGGPEDLWVLGSHVMNLMNFFGGEPAACVATVTEKGQPATKANVVEGREGLGPLAGDTVNAMYTFKNGIMGYFGSKRAQAGSPSRFGLQIYGSKGVVEVLTGYISPAHFLPDSSWSPGRSNAKWLKISSAGVGQPEPIPKSGLNAGNVAAVTDLLAAIEDNRQPLCNIYEARTTIEMIMGVFESHRVGKPVALPLANRKHPLTMLT